MEVRKVNLNYKLPEWVTECNECKSELVFSRKDTVIHTHSIDGKREFFIQCPICGRWQKTHLEK